MNFIQHDVRVPTKLGWRIDEQLQKIASAAEIYCKTRRTVSTYPMTDKPSGTVFSKLVRNTSCKADRCHAAWLNHSNFHLLHFIACIFEDDLGHLRAFSRSRLSADAAHRRWSTQCCNHLFHPLLDGKQTILDAVTLFEQLLVFFRLAFTFTFARTTSAPTIIPFITPSLIFIPAFARSCFLLPPRTFAISRYLDSFGWWCLLLPSMFAIFIHFSILIFLPLWLLGGWSNGCLLWGRCHRSGRATR
mmetsp:Transcript_92084/g.145640  ORF Transcript_92084/g.145640 Transcript_92084/m.145640 type:complete len:246 (+) Transcript_92084:937-1674(+)